jgi:hypothetical protein
MTISIENRDRSGLVLLQIVMQGDHEVLKPFAFPSQGTPIKLENGQTIFLVRVPLVESNSDTAVVPSDEAREIIPVEEIIGKGLDGYLVNSLADGHGGKINGAPIEAGASIDAT